MFGDRADFVGGELVLVLGRLDASVLDLCDSGDSVCGGVGWAGECCEDEEWRGDSGVDEEGGNGEGDAGVEV